MTVNSWVASSSSCFTASAAFSVRLCDPVCPTASVSRPCIVDLCASTKVFHISVC